MSEIVTLPPETGTRSLQPRRADWSPAGMLSQARAFTRQPAVARSLPAAGAVALVGLAGLAWSAFSTPPQRDLFAGLADGDKAVVADALRSAGMAYTLDERTGALSVAEDRYHEARMLLASQGLPESAPDADALMGKMPMGASRAVEDQRLRAAREADLARTIEEIDAVKSARVHLAVEQPSVFLRDRSAAAASVMLQLQNGRTLSDGQVRAVTNLVASSVPGLAPEGVSVIDQAGRLLSRNGDAASEASDRQIDIQSRIERRYVDSLNALLTPLLGAGNFSTEVHADVDFAEVQATRESYPKDTAAVREERGNWTKDGEPQGAGGIPGALSSQVPPASQLQTAPGPSLAPPVPGAPPVNPARTTESYNRTFELGREVSVTKQPVGSVKRLSVAVALRDPATGKGRTQKEISSIDALVKGAVGFDQTRGDQIAISSRKFAEVAEEKLNWWQESWVAGAARNLTALLVVLLLVFGIGRPLLKRRSAAALPVPAGEGTSKAAIGGEIASAITEQVRVDRDREITIEMIETAHSYAARADLIRHFVRQDPARAALVVRDLIQSDAKSTGSVPRDD